MRKVVPGDKKADCAHGNEIEADAGCSPPAAAEKAEQRIDKKDEPCQSRDQYQGEEFDSAAVFGKEPVTQGPQHQGGADQTTGDGIFSDGNVHVTYTKGRFCR